MTVDDITAFVRERLDETEATARAATPGPWEGSGTSVCLGHGLNDIVEYVYRPADAVHIALHDPASVLRDVEAMRRILAAHYPVDPCDAHNAALESIPCETLLALASRWSTHTAYRPEWRPEP